MNDPRNPLGGPGQSLGVMTTSHPRWSEFVERLEGPEGCNFRRKDPTDPNSTTWDCAAGQRSKGARPAPGAISGAGRARQGDRMTDLERIAELEAEVARLRQEKEALKLSEMSARQEMARIVQDRDQLRMSA